MNIQTLRFSTESPFDDAARALDTLRRLSFQLFSFDISADARDYYIVSVEYQASGAHCPRTLDALLKKLPSVFDYASSQTRKGFVEPKLVAL